MVPKQQNIVCTSEYIYNHIKYEWLKKITEQKNYALLEKSQVARNVKSGPNCKMIAVIITILSIVFIQRFLDQRKTMDFPC